MLDPRCKPPQEQSALGYLRLSGSGAAIIMRDFLQPFGKRYVDQLAIAYLVFEEESYLPTIKSEVGSALIRIENTAQSYPSVGQGVRGDLTPEIGRAHV